jgi:hypothetical protein
MKDRLKYVKPGDEFAALQRLVTAYQDLVASKTRWYRLGVPSFHQEMLQDAKAALSDRSRPDQALKVIDEVCSALTIGYQTPPLWGAKPPPGEPKSFNCSTVKKMVKDLLQGTAGSLS